MSIDAASNQFNATQRGRLAENTAANWLERTGYKITERNWRRRGTEIDIIATKKQTFYFVEVKYRASSSHGHGIEFISQSKLQHIQTGVRLYCFENEVSAQVQISAIELLGEPPEVCNFIESLT